MISVTTRIWIDVEDVFVFASTGRTPTGIQRLSFELCRALYENYGQAGNIRLVRHSPTRKDFVETSWESLESLFNRLASSVTRPSWRGVLKARLRSVWRLLPKGLRLPMAKFLRRQAGALNALIHQGKPEPIWDPQAGDVLFIPGAAWHPDYARMVRTARDIHGVQVAVLIHDIIAVRRPEWFERKHAEAFQIWIESMLPRCDKIFCNSCATANDVLDYARLRDLILPDTIHPIPIGTGFARSRTLDELPPPVEAAALSRLPAPGSSVLFVSTIEARKNHALLFRVWRNLLEQMPAEKVRTLVFAGSVGWLVQDLMQRLQNTNSLDGKIVLVAHPDDDELAALYRGCRFTLFPSLYEGWGLPVTESLAFGKPCVISNRTSLPEAGGSLARYFDPEDVGDALRVIRATIEDVDGLAAWGAQVAREFRPVPWENSAREVMRHLQPDSVMPQQADEKKELVAGI
jgi:glycosyltransferase involved in cell wall biosynthesis